MNTKNNIQTQENQNKNLSNGVFITDYKELCANSWNILFNKNNVKNKEVNKVNNINKKYKVNYHFVKCSGVSKSLNIKYFLFKLLRGLKNGI